MRIPTFLIIAASVGLGACASMGTNETPVVDGPKSPTFSSDLAACRSLARNQTHLNAETGAATFLGAAVGALAGRVSDDATIAEGAVGGALGGAAMASSTAAEKRKQIVMNCMIGRGHNVVG